MIFLGFFILEIFMRLSLKDFKLYFSDHMNKIDFIGVWIFIAEIIITSEFQISFYAIRIIKSVSIAF